jgi:hypothetical protein
MRYWVDLEIRKRVRLEVNAESREQAEREVRNLEEHAVTWQKEVRYVDTLAAFEPMLVSFYNPPFVMEAPPGFAFTKEAHEACVRIVAEVCGGKPESWNGFTEREGCGSLSVRPEDIPTKEQIQKVQDHIQAEVTNDMLQLLVTPEIPQ